VTNWRVWILTTVAAVGGAYILGVTEPVRAATLVTYTLDAELAGGDDVTGSIDFDVANQEITGADLTVSNSGSPVDVYSHVELYYSTASSFEVTDDQGYLSQFYLASDLTGAAGEDVAIVPDSGFVEVGQYGVDEEVVQGGVTDGSAGPSSVPEPSSIMATVTAVTLGVGLRRMKRKV